VVERAPDLESAINKNAGSIDAASLATKLPSVPTDAIYL